MSSTILEPNKESASCATWLERYERDGFHFPITAFSSEQAATYRRALEAMEAAYANDEPLRKLATVHANALLPFADEITRLPSVLEPVKAILGENILVWGADFFIKEPNTKQYISWHQDLTYWGLSNSHEVTAWVALSSSTVESGCVKFVPGTHKQNIVEHKDTFAEDNLLSRGQELAVDVSEDNAVAVELTPGQMSLHHGEIFHGSNANQSNDRRIGLAIRYITPDMKQITKDKTHARLVSGVDNFGHFELKDAPKSVLDREDILSVMHQIEMQKKFLYANTDFNK